MRSCVQDAAEVAADLPAPDLVPKSKPKPAPLKPTIDLGSVPSAASLEAHGLDKLKQELQARGLKCGYVQHLTSRCDVVRTRVCVCVCACVRV